MTVVKCLTKVLEHCTTADECRRAVREFADTAQGVEEAGRRLMSRAAERILVETYACRIADWKPDVLPRPRRVSLGDVSLEWSKLSSVAQRLFVAIAEADLAGVLTAQPPAAGRDIDNL